jgi:hypothetical protein
VSYGTQQNTDAKIHFPIRDTGLLKMQSCSSNTAAIIQSIHLTDHPEIVDEW